MSLRIADLLSPHVGSALALPLALCTLLTCPAAAQTEPSSEARSEEEAGAPPAPAAAQDPSEEEPESDETEGSAEDVERPAADPEASPDEETADESRTEETAPKPGDDELEASSEEGEPPSDEDGWMKLETASAGLEEKPPESKPYFRTMLLVEATARYGVVTIAPPGATIEDDDPNAVEHRVGNLGGQATLGVMPGGSVFTMAGRLRGGSYLSQDFTRGNMAAEMLFGANFARNARGNEFTHILGGLGVEFLPGENQDLLTLSVTAATVVKGVSFGGGLMLGANDEIAIGTLGMQVGWGQLF